MTIERFEYLLSKVDVRLVNGSYANAVDKVIAAHILDLDQYKKASKNMTDISIPLDKFEHLLNCLANQKFVHEQGPDHRKETQAIIDAAWDEGMQLVTSIRAQEAKGKYLIERCVEKWNQDLENGRLNEAVDSPLQSVRLMWTQFVWQECRMFCLIGKSIAESEFKALCKSREFTPDQIAYLREMMDHVGLDFVTI